MGASRIVQKIATRTLVGFGVFLLAVYAGDGLYVRLRMWSTNADDVFETVTYPRVLAIPLKDGKTDYEIDATQPEQTEKCVHSLFPHAGVSPCWFVKRQAQKIVPMAIVAAVKPTR